MFFEVFLLLFFMFDWTRLKNTWRQVLKVFLLLAYSNPFLVVFVVKNFHNGTF